nr:hypothetical protein [Lichenicola cladoniae]
MMGRSISQIGRVQIPTRDLDMVVRHEAGIVELGKRQSDAIGRSLPDMFKSGRHGRRNRSTNANDQKTDTISGACLLSEIHGSIFQSTCTERSEEIEPYLACARAATIVGKVLIAPGTGVIDHFFKYRFILTGWRSG